MGDTFKGDERAPGGKKVGHLIAQGLQNLPGIVNLIGSALSRYEKAYTDVSKRYAPQQAELSKQLYEQYGPAFAEIQNRIGDISAGGELSRLRGPGMEAVRTAESASREFDPEFYANRSSLGGRLQELLNNPISGGEYEAMARGLMKMNPRAGTSDVLGATNTAANAMLFGQNARNRQMQNINTAGAVLPTLRTTSTGDVFGMAGGLGSGYNPNLFTKDPQLSQGGFDIGNNMMSGLFGTQNTAMNVNANRRAIMDYVGQAWQQSGLGQATASAAGGAMGCAVAREVFGVQNPEWILFWYWMRNEAPKWFKKLYLKFGTQIANWIKNKPLIKSAIRSWMKGIIYAR